MTSTDEEKVTQFVVALSRAHNETERATPARPKRIVLNVVSLIGKISGISPTSRNVSDGNRKVLLIIDRSHMGLHLTTR
jgi:hypothetical protein